MKYFNKPFIYKSIPNHENKIYITLDDGPCSFTKPILDLLSQYNAKATFFVINSKMAQHQEIVQQMQSGGHAIYTHSKDHKYVNYFKSDKKTIKWITDSIQELNNLTQKKSKVWRPPAGILTPPLVKGSEKIGYKIILWNIRFFDAVLKLTTKKIDQYLSQAKSGDIILLHDDQLQSHQQDFLISLEKLLQGLLKQNFVLSAISESELN